MRFMNTACIGAGWVIAVSVTAAAREWRVKAGGTAGTDCDATNLMQLAETRGAPGDVVRVFPGTYGPGLINAHWSGTTWTAVDADGREVRPEPGRRNPVVIHAAGAAVGLSLQADATVRGFEITGATGTTWAAGSGVWLMAHGATVQNCLLHGNGTYSLFVSNGSRQNTIRGCTAVGRNIEESGMQGVGDNTYEGNRLYDAIIFINDWENSKLDNGFRGADNVYYGMYPRTRPEQAPQEGAYGQQKLGWAGYMETIERARGTLNPDYLPRLIPDFFPTYGGRLLVTLYARRLPVGASVTGATVSVSGPPGKVLASGDISRLTEPLNNLPPANAQDILFSRGSRRPELCTNYTGVGRLDLDLGKLADGEYTVSAALRGHGLPLTNVTATFRHQRLPWDGTRIGMTNAVLPPWTPLACDRRARTVACWGREYTFDAGGLLAQIRTAGNDILAGPVTLEGQAGGQPLAFHPRRRVPAFRTVTPTRVETEGEMSASCGDGRLGVRVATAVEYDGFAKIRLELAPSGRLRLDALRLVIPLKREWARHLHKAGPDMRASVWTGRLPDTPGRVWDSTQMAGRPDSSSHLTVGSFVPCIWIGCAGRGGLAYMADNDRGWFPTDEVPAFEVVRRGDGTAEFTFNLVGRPASFDRPRQIVFALEATPVKPLPPDFRRTTSRIDNLCSFPGGPGPESKTGWDGTFYPLGADGQPVQCAWWGGWANSPFPADWKQNRRYCERLEKEGRIYLPYQTYNFTNLGTPLDPRTQGPEGPEFWKLRGNEIGCDGHGGWCMGPSQMEYRLHRYRDWVRATRMRGFYFDNAYPIVCRKIETGCGYVMDDGRIQPGFTMFGMREFFKRLYAMFLAEGLDPVIFTHSTDTVMPAAYAFVGVTMNGENAPVTPQTGKYYDEVWQPENLQVQSCPEHWGFMTIVMPLMQGTWPPDGQGVTSLHRQEISAAAWFFLHDTESHYTHHAYTVGWPLGLDTNACAAASFDRTQPADFLPYWEDATRKLAWAAKPDVLIGGYRQDRTYVFGVFNRSREALRNEPVHADLQRLFGERDVKPRVLLNGKLVEAAIEGDMLKVTVTLDPHVYALLKIVR